MPYENKTTNKKTIKQKFEEADDLEYKTTDNVIKRFLIGF